MTQWLYTAEAIENLLSKASSDLTVKANVRSPSLNSKIVILLENSAVDQQQTLFSKNLAKALPRGIEIES